jgi:hypothetical protein
MPGIIVDITGAPLLYNNQPIISNKFDKVLAINNDNDYISIPHHANLDMHVREPREFSFWISPNTPSSVSARYNVFSKRGAFSGVTFCGYEVTLVEIGGNYAINLVIWQSNTVLSAIQYQFPKNQGAWNHIHIKKWNSAPSTSVAPSAWRMWHQGIEVTPTVTASSLTTSSNIRNTDNLYINNTTTLSGLSTTSYANMHLGPLSVYTSLTDAERSNLFKYDGIIPVGAPVAKTGTVSVSAGGSALTGVGTAFLTDLAVDVAVFDSTNLYLGTIESITNDTAATLRGAAPSAASGVNYKVGRLLYGCPMNEKSGTTLNNALGINNGSLINFANTTSGNVNNAWRKGFDLVAA